ncbi:MAG: hypothetical protein ABH854_05900 [Candidatus Diapherotrites archaeon]|nr:hypothetical protein [Candidatus Micrarchaeota archaeon]MBU1939834.1 hypothetical protein [Candidatus Micrarchaeota archaeon]
MPELLLLYKTAALIDRKHKVQKWALRQVEKQQLNAKIWKDRQDIKALLDRELNMERLGRLLKKTKFRKEYESAPI